MTDKQPERKDEKLIVIGPPDWLLGTSWLRDIFMNRDSNGWKVIEIPPLPLTGADHD